MVRRRSLGSVVRAVVVGLVLVGVSIAGFYTYAGYQSTHYQVQVAHTTASPSQPASAYGDLSPATKAVFDRLLTGQAASVGGVELEFFANNAVRYRGEYYTFAVFYDPTSLTPLFVASGLVIVGIGAGLFLGVWLYRKNRTIGSDTWPV